MANKIILPLLLALVIGFVVTATMAFREATSIYTDMTDAFDRPAPAAVETPVDASGEALLVARHDG